LIRLDVSFNQLSIIDYFADLTSLRFLDASNNEFDVLPLDVVKSLSMLEQLDLSHNRIAQLPGHFGELRRLRHLDLSHNNITLFPNDKMDALASVKVRRQLCSSAGIKLLSRRYTAKGNGHLIWRLFVRKPRHKSAQVWHALSRDHTVLPATHAFIRE